MAMLSHANLHNGFHEIVPAQDQLHDTNRLGPFIIQHGHCNVQEIDARSLLVEIAYIGVA